ncbi:hypothetical protein SAMN05216275_13029 [Streptosporangium canum]|uniref:Uncharacterized protein n=1 Tax=Streptosporangium canum TaxID=324952 RepID=A0A1I4B0T9_9ACTN|nr:hypothetical protein [Streptosporangium canum]SFK62000.1 hypothetical protein SAMN05216275_13029 [Streptosporangium canum]
MGDSGEERALSALGAALDTGAPAVRHGLREFPEGTPFLWLGFPGAGEAAVFAHGRQWICLSEPEPGGVTTQLVAGRLDEDPALVVERLMSVMAPVRGRADGLSRVLKACVLGLAAGLGVGMLGTVIMAILVAGNGYLSDTSTVAVYVLAAVLGAGAGLWLGVRWWRLG